LKESYKKQISFPTIHTTEMKIILELLEYIFQSCCATLLDRLRPLQLTTIKERCYLCLSTIDKALIELRSVLVRLILD